jgi:uncharacterized protein
MTSGSHRTAFFAAWLLAFAPPARAQAVDPSGHWEGAIDIPGRELAFQVDLVRAAGGEVAGAISVADASGLPLGNVAVQGRSISFYGRSDQPFNATLSEDGKAMSGNAVLSGYSLPFAMRRTGEARLDPPVTGEAVGKELEGTWSGTVHVSGSSQRAMLTVVNQPDGKSIGRIVSVDEGGLILPVVVAQNGSRVTIEQKGVAGSYVGTLNDDATELTGTFSQRGISVPLTFTRVTK